MPLPLYLAMTAGELAACPVPEKVAYMACQFSLYGNGLSHIPQDLPPESLLILNDRIPVWKHDPELVCRQLAETAETFRCCGVLLDFQRPGEEGAAAVARAAVESLTCPVGVSALYAEDFCCPVFLDAPAPDQSLASVMAPWEGREIWMELAAETLRITVTGDGAAVASLPWEKPANPSHWDEAHRCRYHTEVLADRAVFTLSRMPEDVPAVLEWMESAGITRAVGLYQQLK